MEHLTISKKGWKYITESEDKGVKVSVDLDYISSFQRENIEELPTKKPQDHINRMVFDFHNCKEKEVEELSENEKFAICFLNGVEIDFFNLDEETQSYLPITRFPCGIAKIDGKFHVYEARR